MVREKITPLLSTPKGGQGRVKDYPQIKRKDYSMNFFHPIQPFVPAQKIYQLTFYPIIPLFQGGLQIEDQMNLIVRGEKISQKVMKIDKIIIIYLILGYKFYREGWENTFLQIREIIILFHSSFLFTLILHSSQVS